MLGNTMKKRLGVFAITTVIIITAILVVMLTQLLLNEALQVFARSYYHGVVGMSHTEAWDAVDTASTFWLATAIIAAAMIIGLMTALSYKTRSKV